MATSKSELLARNTSELLPKFKVNGELLILGSKASAVAGGLSLYRLGASLNEVKDSLQEYDFLVEGLDEDLKMIEQGDKYSLWKRLEKTYDPEEVIKKVFPKKVKADEKITDKEIKKIRLVMGGWKKVLKNLSGEQSVPDKKLENLQAAMNGMAGVYLDSAHRYTKKVRSYINID